MYFLRVIFKDSGHENIKSFNDIPECLDAYNKCVEDPFIKEVQILKDLTVLYDSED